MAGNQLTTTTLGGSQTTTQSPQTAGAGNLAPGQKSNSLQTGTAESTLDKTTAPGVQLGSATPNAVTLANLPQTTTSTKTEVEKDPRHTSPVAAASSIIFIVLALILIWSAARPVKNTTE